LSDHALSRYVFGLDQTGEWTKAGGLAVEGKDVESHSLGDKTIPSGFFTQPDAENISAVLFTNSGTSAKFGRMGFQHGIGNDTIVMNRSGYCYNPHPDAMDPTFFSYSMDCPPLVESWGQGLVVLHNPNARIPLPRDFFIDAVQGYIDGGLMRTDLCGWHPMASTTMIADLGEAKQAIMKLPFMAPPIAIGAITKTEFQHVSGIDHNENPIILEHGWYSDDTDSFLGVLISDKVDGDWGYVVMARDILGEFRAIETDVSMATRHEARERLQIEMAKLLSRPKRIFAQGDEIAEDAL
jgi:hypothetical protein